MPVSKAEIKEFVARLMDEPEGSDYRARLGNKTWYLLHELSDNYGCENCRPAFVKFIRGIHDLVNIHLDKPVLYPQNLDDFEETIKFALKKLRETNIEHRKEVIAH